MYNLFFKFYCREKQRQRQRQIETACDRKLKNTTPNRMNPKQSFKNHNDSSI